MTAHGFRLFAWLMIHVHGASLVVIHRSSERLHLASHSTNKPCVCGDTLSMLEDNIFSGVLGQSCGCVMS
jgi:hypothetical protein